MLFPHVNFLSFAIGSPLDFCSRRVITVLLEYTNLVLLRYVAYACSDHATSPVFVSSSTSWECGSSAVCTWRCGVCVWSSKCYLTAGILVRFADYRSCLLRWCRSVNRVNLWGSLPLVATVAVVAIVQNHSGPGRAGGGRLDRLVLTADWAAGIGSWSVSWHSALSASTGLCSCARCLRLPVPRCAS